MCENNKRLCQEVVGTTVCMLLKLEHFSTNSRENVLKIIDEKSPCGLFVKERKIWKF